MTPYICSVKNIKFSKYHGCGNDFILIDNRDFSVNLSQLEIENLCHRRYGIGADGLMLLGQRNGVDFTMEYYNSDGNKSSFCGNGGRCIVQYSMDLGIINSNNISFEFESIDYAATIFDNGLVALSMQNVEKIDRSQTNDLILDTGSPHYIHFTENVDAFDLIPFAKNIRYSDKFPEGINVNIVEIVSEYIIKMRTYERGVEDETYSCGTGVTAAAIGYNYLFDNDLTDIQVRTNGGIFQVNFDTEDQEYASIKLIGPAKLVFKGEISI
jgi:diaminopimelate epimerase